jgi:hypothetical protein
MKASSFLNKKKDKSFIFIYKNKFYLNFIHWFVGFTDGEACFRITTTTSRNVTFTFSIALHIDDKIVLEYIQKTLNVGSLHIVKNKPAIIYTVSDYNSIKNIIIPIFGYYPLLTIKQLNFLNFKNAFLLKKKRYQTFK